jgi:hypothetical protein
MRPLSKVAYRNVYRISRHYDVRSRAARICGVPPAVLAVRTGCAALMVDDVLDFFRREGFNKKLPCI